MTRVDPDKERARQLCREAGIDPDSRVGEGRGQPAWCAWHELLRKERLAALKPEPPPQQERLRNAPLTVFGEHEEATLTQMKTCMGVGNVVAGVICADGHLGYAQPVGGVIAYEKQISISGVGFDIGCGNMAVRLDTRFADISARTTTILRDVAHRISFGIGRNNAEDAGHELFDDDDAWRCSDMADYRQKAAAQLGTVGAGNHYVDLLRDEDDFVWIGVHFGSRGLGHACATRYLKAAGGRDGIHVPPAVVDEDSELGRRYIAAMTLSGRYAYAGREWVVERVRRILGGVICEVVHNHHNYAWRETHDGRDLWVVRKGATPAFPGQKGFVGGSMGDDAVILEGIDSPRARASLHSAMHGAGRRHGRKEAKRRFTRDEMEEWLKARSITLIGGDIDESPMAYRRLPDVLAHHADCVRVVHSLRPFGVVMAGEGEIDPWKD
ncbi:MAG: RtcB family protein [Alphaproteobacteria bacterium]|nr:RtcB family protein [Alphaproteobacteria bacterium]